jgi:hypothetical protein
MSNAQIKWMFRTASLVVALYSALQTGRRNGWM